MNKMRDIRDIIDELRRHPDCISTHTITLSDVIESFNDELEDSEIEVSYDDISNKDWGYIVAAIDVETIFNETKFPNWENLPDLSKKIQKIKDRDSKIDSIVKK